MNASRFAKASLQALALLLGVVGPGIARAELLAMLNYESKVGEKNRQEGIAVIDVDPASDFLTRL